MTDGRSEGAGTGGSSFRITWDRWPEVDALFDRVLDQPAERREQFIREECAHDPELEAAVRELIDAGDRIGVHDSQPAAALLRAAFAEHTHRGEHRVDMKPGDVVDRYRLVSELGRGGMATVYEAERADGSFDRRVALKVLRWGWGASELVRRATVERQILSGLQHPNIATLLDGGTTEDGRPFLVMELVDGRPITEWVDGQQRGVRDRLETFLQVADAVAYAHSHLVVHRDLKPSNVLVTSDGQVKLLDFGVAKIVDAGRSGEPVTRFGPAPMTPEYASPEQRGGERVTALSDVYQLGALLYRMLTGRRPAEGRKAVPASPYPGGVERPSDVVPERAFARQLRRDVDTIVMKALEELPSARYRSAEALAADVRRYLAGRPIVARPASAFERARKFSRRNPWFWPSVAAGTVAVGAYVGTVVRYSRSVEQERNEAVAQAERAEALRSFMLGQFASAAPFSNAPVDPDVTVVEAMERGAESARTELEGEPLLLAEMLSAMAKVYNDLSLRSEARVLLDEAMALRREHGADNSAEQLQDLGTLGTILGREGQRDTARVLLATRLDLEREMFGDQHPRTADALERAAWHWGELGEVEQAVAWSEEAVEIRRGVAPPDTASLSSSLAVLSDYYRWVERWSDAERAATEAYDLALAAFGEDHPVTAGNKGHLAQVASDMGELDTAAQHYRELLPVLERTIGEQHEYTLANWNNLGVLLDRAGDLAGAEEVHRRMLEIRRSRYGTDEHGEVGASLQNLAAVLIRQGRSEEADSLARQAEQVFRVINGPRHFSVAFALLTRSEAYLHEGRAVEAEDLIRQAIAVLEPTFGSGYPTSAASCRLGRAMLAQGRIPEGLRLLEAAVEEMEGTPGVPARQLDPCREALEEGRRS